MRTINKTRIVFTLYFPFLFFPFVCGENYTSVSYLNYIFFLAFVFFLLKVSNDRTRLLLSPAYVTALYLYICFLFGDLLFRSGIYIDYRHFNYYNSWTHQQWSNVYINIATYIGLISYYCCPKTGFLNLSYLKFRSLKGSRLWGFIFFFICLIFVRISGEGEISNIAVSLACFFSVFSIYAINKSIESSYRFLFYLVIIASFAIADPDDKRNSIFLFYIIAILEITRIHQIKIKHFLFVSLATIFLFLAIVVMSIFRSASSANENISTKDALTLIPEYITSDASLAILSNNFEIDFVYINSFQSVEFIENNPSLMTYGQSYIKPFFLPIPRSIYPNKPLSAMLQYTIVYDAEAAEEGYCLPLSLAPEAYWNFRYGGIIIVFIYYFFLNWFYNSGINTLFKKEKRDYSNVLFLFAMYLMIMLIRGAGLDIFTLQFLIGFCALNLIRVVL